MKNKRDISETPIDESHEIALTRRQFAVGSVMAASGAAALPSLTQAATPAAPTALSRLTFDWLTVPVGADVGDARRAFSQDEINFMARQFKVLSIEKGMGDDTHNTEKGFLDAAKALKAANPKLAILYYWNALNYFEMYDATVNLNPAWLKPVAGGAWYDLDNPDVRKWWVAQAVNMARNNEVDGIFIDSMQSAYATTVRTGSGMSLIKELRAELNKLPGTPRLIFYNMGQANAFLDGSGNLHPLLQVADGVMAEDFYRRDLARNITVSDMTAQMRGMQTAAAKGKSVILKAWPSFSFLATSYMDATAYTDVVRQARADISFPLAAFLVAAGNYCYLQYSWGWNHLSVLNPSARFDHGVFIRTQDNRSTTVDPTWYPELRRALGSPRGAATVVGTTWTRAFAHATVTCDLAAAKGTLTWDSAATYFPRG